MKITARWSSLTLVALFLSTVSVYSSPSPAEFKNKLQKIVDDYYQTYSKKEKFTAISASVLIPHEKHIDNKDIITVLKGTVGEPPYAKPINGESLFDIGSITKSFTAVILLQLQTEGKLSLEDPLGKWLPQYPEWKDVTLRQLLNMTSGIPNYSENAVFLKKEYENLGRKWTNEELLDFAHPEEPLPKDRSNRYEYCNSNYILAALIIEKVTKDSFENQLVQRILTQKDYLKNTFYPTGPLGDTIKKALSNRMVHGYFYDEKTKKMVDTFSNDLSWAGAAGALVANTEDVVRWVQLLYRGTLITPTHRERALAELEAIVSLKTGLPIAETTAEDPVGFGLGVAALYDKESKQHFWMYEGSTLGFRVLYLWNPCNDVTTVVALNSKGGEGDKKSTIGDHIHEANMSLYRAIMEHNPELQCEN